MLLKGVATWPVNGFHISVVYTTLGLDQSSCAELKEVLVRTKRRNFNGQGRA